MQSVVTSSNPPEPNQRVVNYRAERAGPDAKRPYTAFAFPTYTFAVEPKPQTTTVAKPFQAVQSVEPVRPEVAEPADLAITESDSGAIITAAPAEVTAATKVLAKKPFTITHAILIFAGIAAGIVAGYYTYITWLA